jgi:hypothetical protein
MSRGVSRKDGAARDVGKAVTRDCRATGSSGEGHAGRAQMAKGVSLEDDALATREAGRNRGISR